MNYQYRKAPNPIELSVFEGLGTKTLDQRTLAKDVPCQAACPAKTDVPAYIQALAEGDPGKAYRINLEDNVFPSVLGRVCTRPCEDACRHTWTNIQGPVQICHLKRAGADHSPSVGSPLPAWYEKTHRRIAVIGGGPAGLTAARELVRYGHSVTLFERENHLGGMMVDGIPRFRLPLDKVEREVQLIVTSGVEVRLNADVDRKAFVRLVEDYDAVLVAAGTMKPKALGLDTGLGSVWSGLDFMKKYNAGQIRELSGDVVVVGGGFTAVDCARACARAAKRLVGSEHAVTLGYRRTEHAMAADLEELEEIRLEQIDVRTLVVPVRVNVENDRLVSVTFRRNKVSGQLGKDGKPEVAPIADSEFDVPCSHLIVAIGQDSETEILPDGISLAGGVSGQVDAWENPGQRTSHPKVFAAGDFLTGSSDVIHAVAEGKAAADEIDRFLVGEVRKRHHVAVVEIRNETQTGRTRDHDLQRPMAMPLATLTERAHDDAEVEKGHTHDGILSHATRCYLCNHKFEIEQDKCIHCDWCIEVAPRACIKKVSRVFQDPDGVTTSYTEAATAKEATFIFIDSDECIRCGKCLRACPTGAISMRKMERTACASEKSLHDLVADARAAGRLAPAGGWTPIRSKL